MGWVGIVGGKMMVDKLSAPAIGWLLGGGIVYTTGVVFYKWKKLPFNHAIWHLFAVGGAVCHFVSIYEYVLPLHTLG